MNRKLFACTLILIAAIIAACAPVTPAAIPIPPTQPPAPPANTEPTATPVAIQEITINADDFAFQAPDSIVAGLVRVKLTNAGKENHHVQFLRLNDGVTLDQFKDAAKKGVGPVLTITKQLGGVGAIAGKEEAQVILNLPSGTYMLLCLLPSPSDGVSHVAKGMLKPLQVKASVGADPVAPAANAKIQMKDFAFDMPTVFNAGKNVFQVSNDGAQGHEWNIIKLADGKTAADMFAFFTNPAGQPPFHPVGGMNGLDKGVSGFVELDFKPGNYMAICRIPDPASGKTHLLLGMQQEFTVK